jgi:hypothetical protein
MESLPVSSSTGVNIRPRYGPVPSVARKFDVTFIAWATSPVSQTATRRVRRQAATDSNSFSFCRSRKLGQETNPLSQLKLSAGSVRHPSRTMYAETNRSGSRHASGRSNTPSTTEKIAVVAPMPRPSVRTTVIARPGRVAHRRTA